MNPITQENPNEIPAGIPRQNPNRKKLFLLIAGTVALAALALGAFLVWQQAGQDGQDVLGPSSPTPAPSPQSQPSDTSGLPRDQAELDFAGWQTYRNDEFDFEVKYPDDSPPELGPTYDPKLIYFGEGPYEYRILMSILSTVESAEPCQYSTTEEAVVGGVNGVKYVYEYEGGSFERGVEVPPHERRRITVEVERNEKLFQFYVDGAVEDERRFAVFNQILSTFRFVETPIQVFCQQQNYPRLGTAMDDSGKDLPIRIGDNEGVVRLCGEGAYGGRQALYLLDSQKNILFSESKGVEAMRQYAFDEVRIIDIDGDGVDEVVWENASWSIPGSTAIMSLYSPRFQEKVWMHAVTDNSDPATGEFLENPRCANRWSENLDQEEFQVFKEFLLQEMQCNSND